MSLRTRLRSPARRWRAIVSTKVAHAFPRRRPAAHAHPDAVRLRQGRALNAGGEPGWSAQLRGGVLRFTSADGADLAVKASVQDHGRAGAVWSGALPATAGRSVAVLRLAAAAKPCQDAATGLTYPFTAAVEVAGKRYAGCAAPPGQGLGPRT